MFTSGIEEQIVKECTGHRSDAVRAYKHTSESLLEAAEHATIGNKNVMKAQPTATVTKSDFSHEEPTVHVKLSDEVSPVAMTDSNSGTLSEFLKRVDER